VAIEDDFTGIVGPNLSFDKSDDDDEELDWYKEKYSRLLSSAKNDGSDILSLAEDEDDKNISIFNFIPSIHL